MGLSINQNIAAVNAYHNLSNTQNDLSKSLEKLSSGFRINRAADDAAGLAISEGLRSQIGGLKVAVRNAQDGTSVVQTAEGALNESTSILQRMRDLSVQASNTGGLSADAKGNIQSEMSQLKSELTRISDTTQFNGTKLLDGSYNGKFQVGANVGETISVAVSTSMGAKGLGVDGVDVTTTNVGNTVAQTTASAAGTAGVVTVAGAKDFTLSESFDGLNGTISVGGKSLDLSTVQFASGSTATDRNAAVQKAADATFGTGYLTVANTATGLTFTQAAAPTAANLATNTLTGSQASGADLAITAIDTAIRTVSTVRANLGAVQNRFDHTVKNLNVAVENLSASESRIRDTDMASEMVSFTRAQILSQAGTSMLAQANQLPQSVLKLLG
ncbi:MAG: flagellin [Cellulomonas sp. 73-145]|uniref:flagellin N-terminal helical domain-containing protein n=1 Tax=Cellulomonas sp. 73-145 TaxID=1895739 RepID=UPI00092A95C1|nr:flagellin [Cellulomonas sp. 73-145]MBN9326862.1 flagellin [Cellulomonas sp.]OJV60019.1 MAG: flagellin [Cellulomonas sp. 73-145]